MTRVLIVEDDFDIRELLTTVMKMTVDEVVSCWDGEEALALAARTDLDLIVLDLALPGPLNGLDILAALRASGHPAKTMLLTAYAGTKDRAAALAAGADSFVAKPFNVNALMQEVRSLVEGPAKGTSEQP